MDTVVHDKKEYKKLAVLADEFGYTTDYIGQLCRAGKVEARLVGRAWYVLPESLKLHKKNRYQETSEKRIQEENEVIPEKNYEKRVDVEVQRTKKTTKIHRDFHGNYQPVNISYESDQDALIPTVKKPDPKPASVVPDVAATIKVHQKAAKRNATRLSATELPKVDLNIKVPVVAVPERAGLPVTEIKEHLSHVKKLEIKPVKPNHLGRITPQNHEFERVAATYNKVQKHVAKTVFQQDKKTVEPNKTLRSEDLKVVKPNKTPSFWLPLAIWLVAIVVAVTLLGLEDSQIVTENDAMTEWQWRVPF